MRGEASSGSALQCTERCGVGDEQSMTCAVLRHAVGGSPQLFSITQARRFCPRALNQYSYTIQLHPSRNTKDRINNEKDSIE